MDIIENMCGYISQGDTPGKPEVKICRENDTHRKHMHHKYD